MKRIGLVAALMIWMLAGVVGHDPWKPDEAYSMGLVHHVMKSGDDVVPMLGGMPFLEKPMLFYTTAALTGTLFGGVLPEHDAARLASCFYVGLTMLFLFLCAREFGRGRAVLLLFCGSVGILQFTHLLVTDNALMAGVMAAVYGGVLFFRRPSLGGFWLGTGVGAAFMAKGLIGPGFLGLPVLLMPLVSQEARTKRYLFFLMAAALAVLPWFLIWPVRLYLRDPLLFDLWFWYENIGRFMGSGDSGPDAKPFWFYPVKMLWFVFPVWIYGLAGLFYLPSGADRGRRLFPLMVVLNILLVLSLARTGREIYLLPVAGPCCIWALDGLISGRLLRAGRYAACVFRGVGVVLAVLLWTAWGLGAAEVGWFTELLRNTEPGYEGLWHPGLFFFALAVTGFGLYALFARAEESLRFLQVWFGIVLLGWGLVMTLWLPLLDSGKSYQRMFESLSEAWPVAERAGPVGSLGLHDPQHALLDYYLGVTTIRKEEDKRAKYLGHYTDRSALEKCSYFFMRGDSENPPAAPDGQWEMVWEGARAGNAHKELYRLYRRLP